MDKTTKAIIPGLLALAANERFLKWDIVIYGYIYSCPLLLWRGIMIRIFFWIMALHTFSLHFLQRQILYSYCYHIVLYCTCSCQQVMSNINYYIEILTYDLCGVDDDEAICEHLSTFADDCVKTLGGSPMPTWRTAELCR